MTPYPHQSNSAPVIYDILKQHGLVYIAWEERTGKTLTSILVAENTPDTVERVLVITKKKALEGWRDTFKRFPTKKQYIVVNYHQVKKLEDDYDLIILDEAHNYVSSFPKVSSMWHHVAERCACKPMIYMSATPYAQGYQLLFNQLKLSSYSPWRGIQDPYDWFREYGIPDPVYVAGGQLVETYKKVDERCFKDVEHLFHTKTRDELGFEHEPEDRLHYVDLSEKTKMVYNLILEKRAINLNGYDLVCDTIMKLRTTLHMLEGGVALVNEIKELSEEDMIKNMIKLLKKNSNRYVRTMMNEIRLLSEHKLVKHYMQLGNTEKIDYIKRTWGDTDDMVIMYNYIAEKEKLEKHFQYASILQATSYAEGVDLSGYDTLIIYSQDFSTARHTQRRARQANKKREQKIVVHYLVVKDGLSEQVYNTVSVNKQNFVDKLFETKSLK